MIIDEVRGQQSTDTEKTTATKKQMLRNFFLNNILKNNCVDIINKSNITIVLGCIDQ